MQATRTLRKPSTPGQRYRDGQRKKQTVYHGNPVREPQKLTAEQQALVVQWTGLVSWAMNRWFSKAPAWMHPEIRSAGFLALVEAAERYDAKKLSPRTGKPVKFKTCALAWLWGRMVSERSRLGDRRDLQMPAVVREPGAKGCGQGREGDCEMLTPLCRHCGNANATRPRGLCWRCYYTPGVKELYPSTSKYARRGVGASGRLPARPTDAPPGSWAKVAVMAARAANGETVNHPGDATDWTDFGHLAAAMPPTGRTSGTSPRR